MNIGFEARMLAEQIVQHADEFGAGLDNITGNLSYWSSGKLWDEAILSMRGNAGSLANSLELAQFYPDEILNLLPKDLVSQLDERLKAVRLLTKEMHKDLGGEFAADLAGFREFGDEIAGHIRKALEEAEPATTTVKGADILDWNIVNNNTGAGPVADTRKGAEQLKVKAVGET